MRGPWRAWRTWRAARDARPSRHDGQPADAWHDADERQWHDDESTATDADVKHADAQPADDDAEDANAANAADARPSRRHDAQWLQYGNERNDDARPWTWRHARHAAGPTWNGTHDDAGHEAYDGPWPPRDASGYGQQTPSTGVQHEFTGPVYALYDGPNGNGPRWSNAHAKWYGSWRSWGLHGSCWWYGTRRTRQSWTRQPWPRRKHGWQHWRRCNGTGRRGCNGTWQYQYGVRKARVRSGPKKPWDAANPPFRAHDEASDSHW